MTRSLHQRPKPNEAGFTLLETIMALVLTGVLVTMLATITGLWLGRWDAGTRRAQDVETLGLAINRIANDISAAIALPQTTLRPMPLFLGAAQRIIFIREAGGQNGGGLEVVKLATSEASGLIRTNGPGAVITSIAQATFTDSAALLPPGFEIAFAYESAEHVWQEDWAGDLLPRAVRVTLKRQAAEPGSGWTFIVPIKAGLPATCGAAANFATCKSIATGQQAGIAAPDSTASRPAKPAPGNTGDTP